MRERVPGRRVARHGTLIGAALILSTCSPDRALEPCIEASPVASAGALTAMTPPASEFDAWFEAAGRAHDVEPALLRAIAWTETRLHMAVPDGHDDDGHHGQPPAWGVMALRGERLQRAARLAGLDPNDVRRSASANIHAAAALLAEEARAAGVSGLGPAQWAPALERFSGIELPAGRQAYARDAVLPALHATLAEGAIASGDAGFAAPAPAPALPLCNSPPPPVAPPAVALLWRPSPNFDPRMDGPGGQLSMVIIHTCEGSYVGCWSWLANPVSRVSAHYVINEEGTEISQLVAEPDRAWHIGARYDCALNRGRRCDLDDVQSNHFTIGIEHAGFASQSSFPSGQIDASAALVCGMTQRHGVPRDVQHIVAHGQLQPWNRTDPGPNWPWVRYLALVQRHCGEIVADDGAAFNDAAYSRSIGPAAWTQADATPGYHGGGYHWASTHPDADDAFLFDLFVERAGPSIVEARWPAGPNRTAAARFTVHGTGGTVLATAQHDQRTSHDTWQSVATLVLAPGWHRVELSRRGATGSVVIADAVRIRSVPAGN
jgi:N-acetyl-anhydromuramyl-L-alanine amidase AmpD